MVSIKGANMLSTWFLVMAFYVLTMGVQSGAVQVIGGKEFLKPPVSGTALHREACHHTGWEEAEKEGMMRNKIWAQVFGDQYLREDTDNPTITFQHDTRGFRTMC